MSSINAFHMTATNRPYLIQKIEKLDPSVVWTVTAKPRKSKRSIEQNERMWQFFTDLADYIGYERSEVEDLKNMVTMKVWPVWKTLPDGTVHAVPPRTSKMGTKEHSEMMDAVERYVSSWGFIWG